MKQKKKNSKKNFKTELFNHHQKLSNFRQNFTNWSLGEQDQLIRRASIFLNLYGCQAVRCKLNLLLKMHFQCFLEKIELMSDNLTTVCVQAPKFASFVKLDYLAQISPLCSTVRKLHNEVSSLCVTHDYPKPFESFLMCLDVETKLPLPWFLRFSL